MNLCRERDPNSIKHYLQDLPNSENMEESYVRILTLIKNDSPGNRKLAATVLRWLLCAVRPLSVKELTDALSFLGLVERNMEECKRDIVHVCHGLVQIEVHNDVELFRFIHFSAHQSLCNYFDQQFNPIRRISTGLDELVHVPDEDVPRLDFRVSIHHTMARLCMKYILLSGLATGLLPADEVYNCRQEFDLLAAKKPFFLYASQAWIKHFHAAGFDADLTSICLELFRNTQHLQLSFQIYWFQKFTENFPRGSTPLHIASYFGLPSIISSLLVDLKGPFVADNQYRTPIYWAAYHGDYVSLKALKLVTTQDQDRQVFGEALLAAVEGDQAKLIADLLSWGADPDACVRGDKNALFYAILKGDSNLPVIQQLIKGGAKLSPEAPLASPLQAAAMAGGLEITHFLLSLNADVNPSLHGHSSLPLQTAVFTGQHEIAELLLKSGADIILAGEKGLIELASMMGDSRMIDILLRHSPSYNTVESEESSSPYTLLPHSIVVETSYPGLSNQPGKVSALPKTGLRIAIRQALRLAKMGNMGQEILSMVLPRLQRTLEANFEALDFGFIEEGESIALEVADELLCMKPTTLFMETAKRSVAGAMIHIAPKVQTAEQSEYYERLLNLMAKIIVRLTDGDGGGNVREACTNLERSLLETIKTQAQRVDQLFAEVEIRMQLYVAMERYPLILRVSARTYLTGIMAIIPPEEGIARFAKFLDGIVSGLNRQRDRKGNWWQIVIFVEMANCAYAYGYRRLYPQITLKAAMLHKAVKGNPKLNPEGIIMNQLGAVMAGGRPDWQWDADEAPWWH